MLRTATASAFPTSRLTYIRNKGTDTCPAESQVRAEVATRLGYDPFFVWAERTIVAQLFRDTSGYHATVQLLDKQGMVRGLRALHSSNENCAELVKAVALAISIGIDPDNVGESSAELAFPGPEIAAPESVPPPIVKPNAPPTPPVLPSASAEPEDAGPRAPVPAPLALRVGVGVFSALNLAPVLSMGGALHAGLAWKYAGIDVELRKSLPASAEGVKADLLAVAVLPCGRYAAFFGCAAASWGQLRVQGARTVNVKYVGLGVRFGVLLPLLKRMSVRGYVESIGALDRTVVLSNDNPAWHLPVASVAVGSDLIFHF